MNIDQEIKKIKASLTLIQERLQALEAGKKGAGRQNMNFEIEDYIYLTFTANPAYLKDFIPVKDLSKETAQALNREFNTGFVKRFGMTMKKLGFQSDVRKVKGRPVRGYHVGRIVYTGNDKIIDYLQEHFEAGAEQVSVVEVAEEVSNILLVPNDQALRRIIGLHFAANGIKSFPTTVNGEPARIYKLRRK